MQLKSLGQQVMVITGASSGIGLATAEMAVRQGVKVVLAARSIDTLKDIEQRLSAAGAQILAIECNVSDRAQVQRLADAAIEHFGRIDTWVNNAGVSIYGRLDEISDEDARKLFDTNFWGVVYGSLIALPHLRKHGGALINVGSEVSEAVAPLQGMYSASKHAVKGFTDALRIEIHELDNAPVSITLIQPTATDTPFPQHARNYMNKEPKLPTPMIEPSAVAKAILHAAEHPVRAKKVGVMAKLNTAVAKYAPALGEKLAAKQANRQQYDERPRNPEGTLYRAGEKSTQVSGRTHGTGGQRNPSRGK